MTPSAHHQVSVTSDMLPERTELLTLDGECDLMGAPEFERRLHEALESDPADVVVDLRGVSFIDSSILRCCFAGGGARSAKRLASRSFARTRSSGGCSS